MLAVVSSETFGTVCELASASTATAYLAVDRRSIGDERFVAVKNFLPELTNEARFERLFTAEMRLAASIDHPFVCKVRDFGRVGSGYYVAMEFLQGESLDSALFAPGLRQESARQPRLLARIAANLADGLHALHEAAVADGAGDVCHGDFTARNSFVLFDGGVRVADFGTGWARDSLRRQSEALDHSYLAPEQLERADLDAQVDVWALGVVLWELLAGQKLFRCPTIREATVQITARRIPPPSEFNRQVSPELDRIVLKALTRNRNKRYSSMREMADELERYLEATGGSVSEAAIASWIDSLFPTGRERNRGLIEMAKVSAERQPQFADSETERVPASGAYLPAAQDEPEHTTHIFAGNLRNTIPSAQLLGAPNTVETVSLRNAPITVRRPRRVARKRAWGTIAGSFVATLSFGFLGFAAVRALVPRPQPIPVHAAGRALDARVAQPMPAPPQAPMLPAALVAPSLPPSIEVADLKLPATKLVAQHDAKPAAHPLPAHETTKLQSAKPSVAAAAVAPKAVASGSVQTGQVFLTTPGGGEVFDKGRSIGRAPGSFELSPGWHTLVIKAGGEERSATVQIRANSSVMVSVPATATATATKP